MTLKAGLMATGIALCAIGGAATQPVGQYGGVLFLRSTSLYASLAPVPDKTHTIQIGDNDWKIAREYGITVSELHKANPGTSWRALQIGQTLNIPVKSGAAGPGGKHTVVKGENDNTISKKYGISVAQLHAVNPGVDWRRLQIGQKLNLPGGDDKVAVKSIETSKVKITAGAVNVRSEPTTASAVKATVHRGTTATVLERKGAWYELRFAKGTVGWVRGDLLTAVNSSSDDSAGDTVNMDLADSIVGAAYDMLGTRYRWGGTSRGGVDCSGLTTLVFSRNGVKLPRTSIEQSQIGEWVDKSDLQPGDLLFFVTGRNADRINHVGIYVGDGKFVHSSSYRGRVVETKLSDYSNGYAGARRVAALQKVETVVEEEEFREETIEILFPSRIVYGADKVGR